MLVIRDMEVIVDRPFNVEVTQEFASFNVGDQGHVVTNLIPRDVYTVDKVLKQVTVPFVTPVPLHEVGVQAFQVQTGAPQRRQHEVRSMDVEYSLTKERPVPQMQAVTVRVPKFNRVAIDNFIEVEVPCNITTEQPIAVEKIVEVAVETTIEQAKYVEEIVEVPVPFDVIIEREIEVIREEIVNVPVKKAVEVPVNITIEEPQENRQYFEVDINVDTVEVEPVEGGLIEQGKIEVTNEELAARISQMKQECQHLTQAVSTLRSQSAQYTIDTQAITKLNLAIKQVATQSAVLHELEARKHILEQDIERLQGILSSGQIQASYSVSYTVPHPDMERLSAELKRLVEENRKMVQEIKSKAQTQGQQRLL